MDKHHWDKLKEIKLREQQLSDANFSLSKAANAEDYIMAIRNCSLRKLKLEAAKSRFILSKTQKRPIPFISDNFKGSI